ncbi:unnamed protein product [Ectocarpus sp. 12 AP-2014]
MFGLLARTRTAAVRSLTTAAAGPAAGSDATLAARRGGVLMRQPAAAAVLPFGKSAESKRMHSSASSGLEMHGTTILCVRKNGKVVMMGDGQVSQGDMVVKPNATKVRKLGDGRVLAGYAGSTADALTLMERLEGKLEEHEGQLMNACVALAKDWRTDKYLRRLEAVVLVADSKFSLKVTGLGDVLAPNGGVIAVGSGQPYALAAARALSGQDDLSAEEVARKSMEIASELCVYTNNHFTMHSLDVEEEESET